MSKMAQTDEIDSLVTSVRNFVSHKEPQKQKAAMTGDRLVLTPDLRVIGDVTQTPADVEQTEISDAGNVLVLETGKRVELAGLEATIAELEAAVTAQSDDWEPDEGEAFDQAAWAVSAFQAPAADSASLVPSEATENAPASSAQATPSREDEVISPDAVTPVQQAELAAAVSQVIDEAALKALVVQIVHDELGGELGERITRNVRKLVRREINRVLTSREMGQD